MAKEPWHTIFGLDLDRHRIGRSLAVRALGLIYFIAITSWWTQVSLLVGKEGLSPAADLHAILKERLGAAGESPFLALPNVFWLIGASDFALQFLCFVGAILAIFVVIGRFSGTIAGFALDHLPLPCEYGRRFHEFPMGYTAA